MMTSSLLTASTSDRDVTGNGYPEPTTPVLRKSDRIMSRREVESMIADGHILVIFEGSVLKLDKWIERHPGGKLPVLHMVGVDASSEISA